MCKKLLFVLFAVICCNGLFAQSYEDDSDCPCCDDRDYRIAIGPKVGVGAGLGSHSNVQNLDFGSGFGFQIGAAFNAHFGRRFELSCGGTGWLGIEVEAIYGKNALKIGSQEFGINCIEVPMLAQLYVMPTLAIEAGVTAVSILGATPETLTHEDVTYGVGEIAGGDVRPTLGLCFKIAEGTMLDVRYNMGVSPLAGNFDTKVSTIMVSFAYLFNIVK